MMIRNLTSGINIYLLLVMLGERLRGKGKRVDGERVPLTLDPLPLTLHLAFAHKATHQFEIAPRRNKLFLLE